MKSRANGKSPSINVNLERLREIHQDLKDRITAERRRPAPCSLALQKLKRQRLRVKEELVRYTDLLRKTQAPNQNLSV